ncbi:glycosyltransferase family 31 protein [Parathielavia appendiculata]|uniref:Glycosyltransferase family 31 protein n=1 Tax=Parathielavia appendiculata TaxID=2587402 RepID=A0AAN6Z4B3_9PEZI|nr:glycosyltransferase family 31 protein [Parathielavia appendiculata]
MLAHQCSARAYLATFVTIVVIILLLTADRLVHHSHALAHLPAGKTSSDTTQTNFERPSKPLPNESDTPGASASNPEDDDSIEGPCNRAVRFLRSKELGLSNKIQYSRRCIRPVHAEIDREEVANVSSLLITGTTVLDLNGDCNRIALPPCEPLTLHVPPAYPPQQGQYGHLLFGVASSYERLQDALPVFSHWLSGSGALFVAVVSNADSPDHKYDIAALEASYRQQNISAIITRPRLKQSLPRLDTAEDAELSRPAAVEQLHFLLIEDMLNVATPQTQWLGVLDDDTFFPALHPLDLTLRQHDHTRPRWLGALADNWVSMTIWGFMAYGGAGTFLSVPLAKQLHPHLRDCIRQTKIVSGDGMLKECVYAHSTTKLTLVEGLHQHDIMGDPSGFFESGRKTLSIHHWKSWYHAPVAQMAAVAKVCGDCFLQRWRFGRDTLLANGYSISVYRDGVDKLDLDRVEGTFNDPDAKFDFVYAPFRPKLSGDQKKSYRLEKVDGDIDRGERFRQVYVHRAPRGEGSEPVDEVVELVWEV